MRQAILWTFIAITTSGAVARAQSPSVVYSWPGSGTMGWQVFDRNILGNGYNRATVSGASGDLVVTEIGTGLNGTVVGGSFWILDDYSTPRELAPDKGNLDVTGLQYMEIDIRHNHPTASVDVGFFLHLYTGSGTIDSYSGGSNGELNGPGWSIGPGWNTIRYPLSLLPPRLQTSVGAVILVPSAHTALGNLTWTIREVRTLGTPLTYRDIVTNNVGTPDDGLDGAFPLNTSDMLAIVGNPGFVSQTGLSRNPAGSGSLQWTDNGGTGDLGDESGASIGWGNGAGWRNVQPGNPDSGNSYNERIADFSNYDRMTVRISASDVVNPAGTVGIEGVFLLTDNDPVPPPTILPSQDLPTDGQYHELVYDLSSVSFLRDILNWGLDVAPHPNDIIFNIDNIRLWNSSTPVGVPGDYNGNGTVDAADYVLWRNGGNLQNEGATPGSNTADDYTYWRSRYGATSGSGAGVAAVVPEPAGSTFFCIIAFFALVGKRRGA